MRNVLFVHYGDEALRGSEQCLVNLIANIDKSKIEPIVICNKELLFNKIKQLKIKVYLRGIPQITIDGKRTKIELFQFVKEFFYFNKIIKKHKIELIYSNSGLPSQLGFFLSKYSKIPLVCHIHAPFSRRFAWMWLFKYADKVIFVSNYIKDNVKGKVHFSGTTSVVYNGIDTVRRFTPPLHQRLDFRKSLGISEDEVVVAQVGALDYSKGVDLLIEAIAIIKNNHPVKLLLIGEGPEQENLSKLASEINISDRVLFLNYQADPESYYKYVVDINVLASRFEGFGLCLIEAAACGLPVVGSSCGGIPEVIEDNRSGFLFSTDDVNDLVMKLSILIKNPDLRKKMGSLGRINTIQKFDMMNFVRNIENEILDTKLSVFV